MSMTDFQKHLHKQRIVWEMNKFDVAAALIRSEVHRLRRAAGVAEEAARHQRAGTVHNLMQVRAYNLREDAHSLTQFMRDLQAHAEGLHRAVQEEILRGPRSYHYA